MCQEVKSSIAHLEEVFRVDVKNIKDNEVGTRKADLPKELKKIDKISKIFYSSLESSNWVVENRIDNVIERYNEIKKMKDIYHEDIYKESTVR